MLNAFAVSGAPVNAAPVAGSTCIHAPVAMMAKPVSEQTMMVSMKVCVMETSACVTGCSVCAAAAAMPPVPSPDSLLNTPRATPMRTAIISVAPANPPMAADGRKASRSTKTKMSSMPRQLMASTTSAPAM